MRVFVRVREEVAILCYNTEQYTNNAAKGLGNPTRRLTTERVHSQMATSDSTPIPEKQNSLRKKHPKREVGARFGRLTIVDLYGRTPNKMKRWVCVCDCGNTSIVADGNLATGRTVSCGCYAKEVASCQKPATKHGKSEGRSYSSWSHMIDRCSNPNNASWKYYGERGIKVCDRWRDFENFFADMGEPQQGMTLDRIDNNKGYEPTNCRWATNKEQQRNKRFNRLIEFKGRVQPLSAWAEELGINVKVISARLKLGWTVEEALTRPVHHYFRKEGKANERH